jgi:hypothetical protein
MERLKIRSLVTVLMICLNSFSTKSQVRSSISIGGGLNHPLFVSNYDPSWFSSFHWNIGLSKRSYLDTHIDLAEIGVKDYADLPGAENDNNIYQFGIGFRRYFTKGLFARAGLAAGIISDGETSGRIFPTVSIGHDFFFSDQHGVEVSLKNDFMKNFDYHKKVSILSLGVAYKFWYK